MYVFVILAGAAGLMADHFGRHALGDGIVNALLGWWVRGLFQAPQKETK